MSLCTIGYEKRTLAEYLAMLQAHRVKAVVDVRDVAWSHKPGFAKKPLAAALAENGIEYLHLQLVGNPKSLRRMATSVPHAIEMYRAHVLARPELMTALEETLRSLGVARRRIALTCFERDPAHCHRSVLAQLWTLRTAKPVRHLGVE